MEEVLFIFVHVYSADVNSWDIQSMTSVAHERYLHSPSLPPSPQQDGKLEVFESNENSCTAVEVCTLTSTAYNHKNIWFRIDQLQDVQHSLRHVTLAYTAELEASFSPTHATYSLGLIYATSVQHFLEPFEPFDIPDKEEW